MPQYMLLIYDDERRWAEMSDAERGPIFQEYFALTKELQQVGAYVAGDPLQPTSTATTVRVRDGETLTTDGPFAETKEQLGGYYLIDAKDLNEAIQVASRIPSARFGSIEVRPVVDFSQQPAPSAEQAARA